MSQPDWSLSGVPQLQIHAFTVTAQRASQLLGNAPERNAWLETLASALRPLLFNRGRCGELEASTMNDVAALSAMCCEARSDAFAQAGAFDSARTWDDLK